MSNPDNLIKDPFINEKCYTCKSFAPNPAGEDESRCMSYTMPDGKYYMRCKDIHDCRKRQYSGY